MNTPGPLASNFLTNAELAVAIEDAFECCSQKYVGGQYTRDSEPGKLMLAHLKELTTTQALRARAATGIEPEKLRTALITAEAALSDIGDADREPGDDVKWCEERAARALPIVRAALSTYQSADNIHSPKPPTKENP